MLRNSLVALLVLFLCSTSSGRQGAAVARSAEARTDVSSVQAFRDALASGNGSARRVIALQAGNYDELLVEGRTEEAGIRIIAADPAKPPVVHRLAVSKSRNVSVEGLHLAATGREPTAASLLLIADSGNVEVRNTRFRVQPGAAVNRLRGMEANNITGLRLLDNRFDNLDQGAVIANADDVLVEHNHFNGMTFAGLAMSAIRGARIVANRFEDPPQALESSPAFILFTARQDNAVSGTVTIQSNVLLQKGQSPMRGIVFNNESRAAHEQITIRDNILVLGSPHGIALTRAKNVLMQDNVVVDTVQSPFNAAVRLVDVAESTIRNNLLVVLSHTRSEQVAALRNVMVPRLQKVARQRYVSQIDEAFRTRKAPFAIHGGFAVKSEHLASGPRTP